jgi:molybdopterin converting factor small subunit
MLADQARVPEEAISLVFVNGRRSDFDQRLSDGDRVAFAPAVGGM